MPVPIVIITYLAAAGLTALATWIASLPRKRQLEIQERASQLARQLFQKAIEQLTPPELKQIADKLKDH